MAKKISRLQKIREYVQAFLDESLFRTPGETTRLYRFAHFWLLVARSFVRNRCPTRAAALSFTTLLALIPLLAIALSVTSSLLKKEGEERITALIEKFVSTIIPPSPLETNRPPPAVFDTNQSLFISATVDTNSGTLSSVAPTNPPAWVSSTVPPTNAPPARPAEIINAQKRAVEEITAFINNIRSGQIIGVGMVLLVFVAIRLLTSIEDTFNDIWGATRGRNWLVRIVIYWATITLGPCLLAVALGVTSGPIFKRAQEMIGEPALSILFKLLPLLVMCLAFSLFYRAVPNTKVRMNAALIGGLVAGLLWYLNYTFGSLFVSRVVTNNAIYGGMALVPVFMIGLYFSWLVVLLGSQVAYAYQNRTLYLQEKLAENVNQRGREFVALRLMTCIGQRFQRGLPPPTVQEMSNELGIPSRLVQQVLHTLIAAHLVIEVSGLEPAYTPARPLETINAHHVLMAMRATAGQELVTRDEPVREEVYGEFARIQEAEKRVASAVTMLTLVNRAQSRLELSEPAGPDEEMKLKHALIPPDAPEAASSPPEVHHPAEGAHHSPPIPSAEEPPPAPEASKPKATFEPIGSHAVKEPVSDEEREFPL